VFDSDQSGVHWSPLVTVAMPVYNAGKYLRLAVISIVKQTFTDWELLIIDDGSTDDALQSIADINDSRIQILRDGKNKGLAARLNECIDLARGRYFARMDQDDVSYPMRFACQIKALQNDENLDMVATQAITISSDNQYTGHLPSTSSQQEISAKPWRGFYLPHPTWMGKIEWFRKYRYAEPAPYFCEDQELLLRSYAKSRFNMIGEPLFAYRVRDAINWRKQIKTRLTVLQVQWRFFLNNRQIVYVFLALIVFFGRITADILKTVFWYLNLRGRRDREEMSRKWKETLSVITGEVTN